MIQRRIGVTTTGRNFEGEIAEDFIQLLKTAKVLKDEVAFEDEYMDSGDYSIATKTDNYYIDYDYKTDEKHLYHIEGKTKLELSEELSNFLYEMYNYYPYDTYVGRVENGRLTVHHAYEAESTVGIEVKQILQGSVTLEVTSTIDQTVNLSFNCEASDDVKGTYENKELNLKAKVPQKVALSFSGGHIIKIRCGNTKVEIAIMD